MSVWSFIQISITIRIYYKLKRFLVWHNIGGEEMSASLNLTVLRLEVNYLISTFLKKHTEKILWKCVICLYLLFSLLSLNNLITHFALLSLERRQWVKQCLELRHKAMPEPNFYWAEQPSELRAGNKREEKAGSDMVFSLPHAIARYCSGRFEGCTHRQDSKTPPFCHDKLRGREGC